MLGTDLEEDVRRRLLDLREELIAFRTASEHATRPVDLDQPIGRLTRIDAIQQQKLTQANRRRNEVRLQQTDFTYDDHGRLIVKETNLDGDGNPERRRSSLQSSASQC